MSATTLQRELFPACSVAATLENVGPGMEWNQFLDRATHGSLIHWVSPVLIGKTDRSAVIGHASQFDALERHIATFAAKSYAIGSPMSIDRRWLKASDVATGRIKKQCSSYDQYALITIEVEPIAETESIQLSIPESDEVSSELHAPAVANAIFDGVVVAALSSDFARPWIGFRVSVVEARWHPVDSHAGVFRRATFMAMSEILAEQSSVL